MSDHSRRWYRYGITQETYEQMHFEQGGLCAVCRCEPRIVNGIERPLSVDHSHKSGHNRGLLCDRCNLILGHAGDSQELLRRLQVYLAKHDGPDLSFIEDNPETAAAMEAEWSRSLSELESIGISAMEPAA
jgi:hypothetical protein